MKSNPISIVGTILLVLLFNFAQSQSFGTFASAVWITDCNQSNFFNTSGSGPNLIGPVGNVFEGANLGVHTQNSGTLLLRGAEVKTFKNPASSNVCVVKMYYRIYQVSAMPGGFSSFTLPILDNCNVGPNTFPSGGPCVAGDQKWQSIIPSLANLTSFAPGNYILEVYYDVTGSFTSTSQCNDLIFLSNGGNNFKANFSIQAPTLVSTNPSTCNGTEGSITINGLVPSAVYSITYTDDGVLVGPINFTANASGQIVISGLNAGLYSNFSLLINGCTTNLNTGVILSNPIFVPTFNPIAPFCAGSTAPLLPTTSTNGITGTWSPATVNNLTSGSYSFTPTPGLCGFPISITITVLPNITPTFSFGTSLTICSGGTVPLLPTTSTNGITGTWSPTSVSNTASGVYTFTPTTGLCATTATFTVTVNPNITPTFSFGTSLTICSGGNVPTLPTTSTNGITGSWSPTSVSNTASGVYTFTPTAGLCATTATFTVTVNPNITPTFSFGTSLTICSGGNVPTLPTTSTNGITGSWSPTSVSNTASGAYTFTPNGAVCATPVLFTVTVNPNITPTFSFGIAQSICTNAAVPLLPTTSTNGITGTWSPSIVSNTTTGAYIFTPNSGQCVTGAITFNMQINTIPTVNAGSDTIVYDGANVPLRNLITSAGPVTVSWVNSNPSIGLAASGNGNFIPSFIAINIGNDPITATITVTPTTNGCVGATQRYVITVRPLNKDVFVPNVFSPNGDGKNDQLLVYGNYINKVEMYIYNQWGQLVTMINSRTQGWDGTHKGKPQPVGVYVYALKAVLSDGRTVTLKGSITLIR